MSSGTLTAMNEKQRGQATSGDGHSQEVEAPAKVRRTRVWRDSKGRPEIFMPASIARGVSVPRVLDDPSEDD